MRSVSIVVIDEGRQAGDPRRGVMERPGIGPLGEQGADEALGLAVRLWPVGPRLAQPDPQSLGGGGEQPAAVAAAVVAQHPLDANAVTGVEAHRSLEEASGGDRRLVGQLLDVGDARMVVDRDVDPVPADRSLPPAAVTGRTLRLGQAAAGADASELLGVEVQQLAGSGALITDDRRPWLEPIQATQPMPAQQRIHRRSRYPGLQARRCGPTRCSRRK